MTKGKDDANKKGQKTIRSFFCQPVAKKSDNEKENNDSIGNTNTTMGLDSNLRKPSIQKAKELARPKKGNTTKITQRTIRGGTAEGRCDEGTKICAACEKLKVNPKFKRFPHDPTCVRNGNYKKTNGGRISKVDLYRNLAEEVRMKELKRPPSGKEICTSVITKEDLDAFFVPRTANGEVEVKKNHSGNDILPHYNTDMLISRIRSRMKEPTGMMRKSKTVPMVISAAVQSLLDLVPNQWKKGTNHLMATDKKTVTYKKLQAYKELFPPGTIGFTFPRADKSKPPDHYYHQVEGRTVYFVCWELNVPGWEPTCYKCNHKMIHDEYDFQSHGYATPIFQISGMTDYAVSMYYNCSNPNCKNRCKANDGNMLMQVPVQYRNGYPVDPRYAVNKETHIARSFSAVMDKMMVTHGNGDQLAIMLNELRADHYLDVEEEYYSQAIDAAVKVATSLPKFENWIGRHGLSGEQLRDLKDLAAESTLVSTGVSDKQRATRELQSVGCDKNAATDHTFAVGANYKDLPKEACVHTMGNNDGECASFVIVKDTKQIRYAHQAEQYIEQGVQCVEGGTSFVTNLYLLFDIGDLENVKRCLREGTLSKPRPGEENIYANCSDEKLTAKARTYRDHVRIWTHSTRTIQDNLRSWLEEYKDKSDENNGEYLFTRDTSNTVIEQINKAKWVVDSLTKDQLYLEVQPNLKSTTGLSTFIGARGSESKLEKAHHAIAHFANTGMRHSLADALCLGGLSLYNLKIRFRMKLARMKPAERSKYASAFQDSPHFTNHLRLSHNNNLARAAGLQVDVHNDVEILQPDNGERFGYEYYEVEEEREKNGVQHSDINRCLCPDCGRYNNYYRKRKPQWRQQQDVAAPTKVLPIQESIPKTPPMLQLAPTPPATTTASTVSSITTASTSSATTMPTTTALQIGILQQQMLLQRMILLQEQQQQQYDHSRFAYSSLVAETKKRINRKRINKRKED